MSRKNWLVFAVLALGLNGAGLWRGLVLWERSLEGPAKVAVAEEEPAAVERLAWVGARVQSMDVNEGMSALLRFNQAVRAEEVRMRMEVADRKGDPVPVWFRETPVAGEILLTAGLGAGPPLRLSLRAGLVPVAGAAAAMESDEEMTLEAPVSFAVAGVEAEMPTFDPGFLDVVFTSPADVRQLRDQVRIEPAVAFSVGEAGWWQRNRVRIQGEFEPGGRYTVRLGGEARGLNGEVLGEGLARVVIFPEREPGVRFAHPGLVLNAAGAKRVELRVQNEGRVRAELHRVHDQNLLTYLIRSTGADGWQAVHQPERNLSAPVWEEVFGVSGGEGLVLELGPVVAAAGQGAFLLRVAGEASGQVRERMILVGDTGLLARRHGEELLVWAVGLADGVPVAGARVQAWSVTRQVLAEGVTDAEGVVRLRTGDGEEPLVLLARRGEALGALTLKGPREFPGGGGERAVAVEANEAFVYTDRGLYRPGETVRVRAIVRGAGFALPGEFPVWLTLRAADGMVLRREQVMLSAAGTAGADLVLDPAWPNGRMTVSVSLPAEDAAVWGQTAVQMTSFVPPQVVAELEGPEAVTGLGAVFGVEGMARMLYGGAAAAHGGTARAVFTPEVFRSSEYPEHVFSDVRKRGFSQRAVVLPGFETDGEGRFGLSVRVPGDLEVESAVRVWVSAEVREFSGRAAAAQVSARVDPFPAYLGVRVREGEDLSAEVDVVRVNADGSAVEGEEVVELVWFRRVWSRGWRRDAEGAFTYVSEEHDVREGGVPVRLVNGRGVVRIRPGAQGNWRVAVSGTGCAGASLAFGLGDAVGAPARADRVALAVEPEMARAGERVKVRVNAPFGGRGLLTVEGDRVWSRAVVAVPEGESVLEAVMPEGAGVNVWVRLSVVRPQPGAGAQPVMLSEGAAALRADVSGFDRLLVLEADRELKPGTVARVRLRGEPGAEVTLAGVDEGILRLDGFGVPDPFGFFAAVRRYAGVQWDVFDLLMPEVGARRRAGDAVMGGDAGAAMRNRLNPVDAKRFRPMAWWSGVRVFPESGELEVEVALPEFTGEIRWMAVQAGRSGVGSAAGRSRVGRGVVTQQSLPLALAPGDVTEWTVRLHNRSGEARRVRGRFGVSGPVELLDSAGRVWEMSPGEVVLARVGVRAGDGIGVARFEASFEAGGGAWSEVLELGVRPVEAFRSVSRFAVLQPGEAMAVEGVEGMVAGTVERSLTVSGVPTLALEGAAGYLARYPYGCLEQTVSGGWPLLLGPALAEAGLVEAGAGVIAQEAVVRVWSMQNRDGSFAYWPGSSGVSVAGGLYALEFLLAAREAGLEVDGARLEAGLRWARGWLLGRSWGRGVEAEMAQAAMVLARAGMLDRGWGQGLRERREDLGGAGRRYAAEALMALGERPAAVEMLAGMRGREDGGAGWVSREAGMAHLLRLLVRLVPEDGRIPELAVELLRMQEGGHWGQTFANAAAVRAMVAYRAVYPLGEGAPEAVWNGDNLKPGVRVVLAEGESGVLVNRGRVPVFVSERRGGVPVEAEPVAEAFGVSTRLLSVEGEVLEGPVRSGEAVLLSVRLTGLAGGVRDLAVDQRLPAGLEPFPLGVQRELKRHVGYVPAWGSLRGAHVEIRDDQVVVFPPELGRGEAEFCVLLRAVSPGRYTLPGTWVHGMYAEDVAGRSAAGVVEVVR